MAQGVNEINIGLMLPAKRGSGKGYFTKDIVLKCTVCGETHNESSHTMKKYPQCKNFCFDCMMKKVVSDKEEMTQAFRGIGRRKLKLKT